jgi:type I restriction enzyme M protein
LAGVPTIPKKKKESMAIYTLFIQHVLNSMKDKKGKSAIVLPTGFITAKSGVEGKILKKIIEDRKVYGVINMPSNIFANTGTNVSVVFFDNSKTTDKVILIDASKMGEEYPESNNKKVRLTEEEINKIVDVFLNKKVVEDFSVAVSYKEIIQKKYSLSAGQYFDIKIEYTDITYEEFENKMQQHKENLKQYFKQSRELEEEIEKQLGKLKYEK